MSKRKPTLRELDNDSVIEHWISLYKQKQECIRCNDYDGLDFVNVNIKLTQHEMRERGLFNVNVNRNERS